MIKYICNRDGEMTKLKDIFYVNEVSEINLQLGKLNIPIGCIPLKTEYIQNDKGFVMRTSLGNITSSTIIYNEMIVMKKEKMSFHITSPYNNILSVANEISIALLQTSNVITIHSASAYKKNDKELLLFCGESNSGKSTTIKELCNDKNYIPVADDHIHLKFKKDKIFFSVPIWDEYRNEDESLIWKSASKINIISIGKKNSITNWIDVMKYIVGMGMFQQSSLDIIDKLIRIESDFKTKLLINKGYYQNAKKTIQTVLERCDRNDQKF